MRNTINVESLLITGRPAETLVDMLIKVEHLPEPVPFTANPADVREYGRQLYAMAISGEWAATNTVTFTSEALAAVSGQVAPTYIPPAPMEIAVQENPIKRQQQMKYASAQATHFDMMGDPTQAAAWRGYYRELYALEQAPDWPLVEQWPSAPTTT